MRHAEGLVRREPVVHVGREGLVGALGHEALLVKERQNAGRLRLDQSDAVVEDGGSVGGLNSSRLKRGQRYEYTYTP